MDERLRILETGKGLTMKSKRRIGSNSPAMASEPFLGEIIIFFFQLIRLLFSFFTPGVPG